MLAGIYQARGQPVPVDEELDRTIPVLEILRAEFDVLLSIDTSTPELCMQPSLPAPAW